MSELTKDTTHYIVHSTCIDPLPESTYGTSPAYNGDRALERAIKAAQLDVNQGRRSFVTARDDESSILMLIPVVDYPVAKETHVPDHAQDAVTRLFADLDWTP